MLITFSCADDASEVVAIFFTGPRPVCLELQVTANFTEGSLVTSSSVSARWLLLCSVTSVYNPILEFVTICDKPIRFIYAQYWYLSSDL